MKIKYLYIILLLPLLTFGQENKRKRNFGAKSYAFYQHEFDLGLGVSNYFGELGGSDGPATKFSPKDLEFSQFKLAYSFAYRYNFGRWFALRSGLMIGKVSGSDQLTQNRERNYRNLSFTSNITEFMVLAEGHLKRGDFGHGFYKKGVTGKTGQRFSLSGSMGFSVFKFNPTYNGIKLQPLSTEGQGLPGGSKPYKTVSVATVFGISGGYMLNKNFRISLEFLYRFTRTDYLDDVSGKYYDKEAIRQAYGDLAAEMSNRSNGDKPSWTSTGAPRGSAKNKDNYFTTMAVLTYTPMIKGYRKPKKRYRPKF